MTKASFTVLKVSANRVYIQDDFCGDLWQRPVTNDVEAVVKELYAIYPNHRIFAIDTEQYVAELVHENGVFKGFR